MTEALQDGQPIVSLNGCGEVVFNHGGREPAIIRAAITALKDQMLARPDTEKLDLPVKHTFADGMYMRELFVPKGTLLIGKIHRKACLNIVAAGDISLLTERGTQRVQAGFTGVSGPGVQKVGYAHEDTLFINVFRCEETDVEKVEQMIACENFDLIAGELPCL